MEKAVSRSHEIRPCLHEPESMALANANHEDEAT